MIKSINISGHEKKDFATWTKHVIFDGKMKYQFGETKKDGNKTKAFTQWDEGLKVGMTVEAEVAEEEKEYEGRKYTQRTILYFLGVGDQYGMPYVSKDIDLSEEDETTYGDTPKAKTLEEKVNILWKEREVK